MKKYKGKVVFICGGSSGIGYAAAAQLARAGARTVIFARRNGVLKQAHRELEREAKEPGTISAYSVDLAETSDSDTVLRRAVEEVGIPDIVINAAGGAMPRVFFDIDSRQLEEIWRNNFVTCWNVCKVLIPFMVDKRAGHVVNISSMAGLLGVYGYTDYCAVKFGIVGFSEALRSELADRGVSVQVFCPADTLTPGFERENLTKPKETVALSETASVMTANDVAKALLVGVGRRNFILLANWESRFLFTVSRLCPWLMRWSMDRITARAARG